MKYLILIVLVTLAGCASKKVIIKVDTCENIQESITICEKVKI